MSPVRLPAINIFGDNHPEMCEKGDQFIDCPYSLGFLGRRLHHRFDGEVLTDCKMDREPGARIKQIMSKVWFFWTNFFGPRWIILQAVDLGS